MQALDATTGALNGIAAREMPLMALHENEVLSMAKRSEDFFIESFANSAAMLLST